MIITGGRIASNVASDNKLRDAIAHLYKQIRRRKRPPEAHTSVLGDRINRECTWIDHQAEVLGAGLDLITERMYGEGREKSQSGR